MNARAEELKAQLLKNKERANSGTPPVTNSGLSFKPPKIGEAANSNRGSPMTPGSLSDGFPALSRQTSGIIEDELNDLISEAKAAADTKKKETQKDKNITKPQNSPMNKSINTRVQSAETSTKTDKTTTNIMRSDQKLAGKRHVKQESNEEMSDISEGEIREDLSTKASHTSAAAREFQNPTKPNNEHELDFRQTRQEAKAKPSQSHEVRDASPRRNKFEPRSRIIAPRVQDDRHEDVEDRPDRKAYQINTKHGRMRDEEHEQRSYLRRDTRNVTEDNRRHEVKHDSRIEEPSRRKSETPTLAQLLLVDEDLKEWLDVTGYHNIEYRSKILNRRRAIAALDAQKAKLLEEMEIDERGGLLTAANATTTAGMLPPPIPSKMGVIASTVKPAASLPSCMHVRQPPAPLSQDAATKRTYNDYREPGDDEVTENMEHDDEQGRGVRTKNETRMDDPRRRSTSADGKRFRYEDRDNFSDRRGRGRGRSFSNQRDLSPGSRAYESRHPARSRNYDFPMAEESLERNTWRGNYRGRAYDPNYRGRGRGRVTWNEQGEGRFEQRQRQESQSHNQSIESMRPYKHAKELDLGGEGG